MRPAGWLCRALYRLDKNLRFGRDDKFGCFAVLYLVPWSSIRDTEGKIRCLQMPWERRGPVFSKNGEIRRDWPDSHGAITLYLKPFDEVLLTPEKLIHELRLSRRPALLRQHEAEVEEGKQIDRNLSGLCEEAGDKLYRDLGRTSLPTVAKKFIETDDLAAQNERGDFSFAESNTPDVPQSELDRMRAVDEGDAGDLGEIRS